ncbi:MAG: hypothetical protein K6G09_08995 [Treponema sp.]|nr:hypothetical protein [Treponema sp.]
MKRKLFALFLSVFFAFALWAQKPTQFFPYEYYNSSERDYYDYVGILNSRGETLEDDSEWTVTLYNYGSTYYIVTKYKPGKEQSENKLIPVLTDHSSTYKKLDSKIDESKGRDYHVCLVFFDSEDHLICSAQYSENY